MVLHLHIMVDCRLFHVVLHIVSQSDTESGVRLALALTVQKLADRRIVSLSLCAAIPMVEGLMDFPHTLLTYCGNVMAHVVPHFVIMCMY